MNAEQRREWLAQRQTGLGSSEIAAVCGLSPFQTALGVYLIKTGQLPAVEETSAMRWGTALEPAIAAAYTEETGVELEPCGLFRRDDEPWMVATPDRVTMDPAWDIVDGQGPAPGHLVELKTASAYVAKEWGEPWTDQIPDGYLLQCQWQMLVTGFQRVDVAVLIGGQDFRRYTVHASRNIFAHLLDLGREFWSRVELRQPPEPDWSHARTPALIEALYPVREAEVEMTTAAVGFADDYERLGRAIKAHEMDREATKAHLVQLMDGASVGRLPDGRIVTRKMIHRKGYTVEPGEHTQFSIRAPRKARTS